MEINNSNSRILKGINDTKKDSKVSGSAFKDSGSSDVQTKDLTSYKSAVESAEAKVKAAEPKVTSAEQNLASAINTRDNTSPTIKKQVQKGTDENNNPIYETVEEPNPQYQEAVNAVAAAEGELSAAKEEKAQAEEEQSKAQEELEKAEKENEEAQEALNTAEDEINVQYDFETDEYTQLAYLTEEEYFLPQENYNQYLTNIDTLEGIINNTDKESFYEILNNESLTSEDWVNIIRDYNQNYSKGDENKTFVNALYTNLSKTTEAAELDEIMDTVASKLSDAANNGNPIALGSIQEINNRSYTNLTSNTDISELSEIAETITQLDIEQYSSPEDQNKAWAINDLINTLNSSMNNILEQDKEDGAISDGYNFIKEITGCGVSIEDIKKALADQKETIQKLTDALNGKGEKSFEETYKELTGTTYDDKKLTEYKDAEINYNMAYQSLNNAYSLCDLVKNCNSYDDLLQTYKNFYGNEKKAREEISAVLLDGYKAANAESVEIDENNKIHIKYRDGKEETHDCLWEKELSLVHVTIDSNKAEYQNKYSQIGLEAIENYFGKSYKELQEDYIQKENNALGTANAIEQTVNKYCEDQDGFIDNIAHKAQLAGMCMIAGGAIISVICPPAGAACGALMSAGKALSLGGMFGNQVAEIIDSGTSENGITKEDVAGLLKETATELSYLALGSGINHVAEALQVQSFDGLIEMGVSENTAKVLSWLVEGGTDMALSVMSDLVITGDANFNGNSMQVLMGILTGVASAKVKSYQADIAADSKIQDIRSELSDVSEADANAEVLRRFGYDDSEIAEMAGKSAAEVDKAIIRERKTRAFKYVLEQQGVDTSRMSNEEIYKKGVVADAVLKNAGSVAQEGDDGSCAIAAVLNSIVGKGKNAVDRLCQKITYDDTTGKFSCSELGIEGVEVDVAGGEDAISKIYEAFKASNPDLSEGTCAIKVLGVLMDGGSDIVAKFNGDNLESIKSYANDSDTILTLNTGKSIDIQNADGRTTTLKEGHAYTVSGYDSQTGELILIDPQNPNSMIKVAESDFNKLFEADTQVEGKTYIDGDDGLTDGSEARVVGGRTYPTKNLNKVLNSSASKHITAKNASGAWDYDFNTQGKLTGTHTQEAIDNLFSKNIGDSIPGGGSVTNVGPDFVEIECRGKTTRIEKTGDGYKRIFNGVEEPLSVSPEDAVKEILNNQSSVRTVEVQGVKYFATKDSSGRIHFWEMRGNDTFFENKTIRQSSATGKACINAGIGVTSSISW